MRISPTSHTFLVTLTALLFSHAAYPANKTWNNIGTDFNTAANWTGGVPGIGDSIVFNVAMITNPNLSASLTIQQMSFSTATASGYDLTSSNTSIKLTLTATGTGVNSAINSAITSGTNTIDAPIVLGAASGTQSFTQASGGTLIVNGVVSSTNTVALSLRGSGTFQLNGANIFSGGVSIDGSNETLVLGNNSALGSGSFTINHTFTLQAGGGARVISNAMTLGGDTTLNGAYDLTFNGDIITAGALTRALTVDNTGITRLAGHVFLSELAGTGRTLSIDGAGALTIDGAIADYNGAGTAGNLTYNSTTGGTLTLLGTNTYSGATTLSSGNLILGNRAAFGTSAVSYNGVTVSASTDLSGPNAIANTSTLGASGNIFTGSNNIELSGTLTNNNGITNDILTNNISGGILRLSGQVILSNNNTSRTLILNGTGNTVISGVVSNGGTSTSKLTYSGTGTLTLSNSNTYSGVTTVSGGALLANNSSGSATGSGAVTVTGIGTLLGGNGTMTGAVSMANGTNLSPGATSASGSTAMLRTGALTLSSGSNFIMDLLSTTAGTGYDQVGVTGPVNITGSNLVIRPGAGLNIGDKFFILLNDGSDAITGTFAGGTTVTFGIDTFLINYADNGDGGTTSNDISLRLTSIVPEPATWVPGIFAVGILAWHERRRFCKNRKGKRSRR